MRFKQEVRFRREMRFNVFEMRFNLETKFDYYSLIYHVPLSSGIDFIFVFSILRVLILVS